MVTTSSAVRVRIEFAQASDPGRDPNKQVNEDSCGYAETKFGHLLVLCDGMGGHYGGKEASRTAITTIFEMMERAAPNTPPSMALKAAIEEAGRRVYLLGGPPENRTRPGSTVVSLLMHDAGMDVAHVGDSRGYIIRANQIYPLTRDHSMVQAMIDAGMLTEQQAIGHPDANKITRALGMKPEVEVEVRPEPMDLFAGDVVLLSSDGLTDLALGPDILGAVRQALASGNCEHACKTLVDLANNRGGHDNITVQMARVLEVPPKARATIPQGPSSNPGAPASLAHGAHSAGAPAGAQRPPETFPMTAPDAQQGSFAPQQGGFAPQQGNFAPQQGSFVPQHAPYATPPAAPSPAGMQQNPAVAQQWAPVQPTATDLPPHARGAAGPTMNEPPHSGGQWGGGMYQNPPPAAGTPMPAAVAGGAPGLAAYRIDAAGPASLPLPPPAFSPPAPTVGPTGTPPPSAAGAPGGGFGAAAPAGYGGPSSLNYRGTPAPPFASIPPSGTPAKGGVVYVIIGLSVVIAVLLLVLLWALFAR